MLITEIINPNPIKIATAKLKNDGLNWEWKFESLDKDLEIKNRNFIVYFYVSKNSNQILKIGSTDGEGGLKCRVVATSNGNKGTPGGHDEKMQPIIFKILSNNYEIDLYYIYDKPIIRNYLFQGNKVEDLIVDSTTQEKRYICLYKEKNNNLEPPFNFNNRGKRNKKLNKDEFKLEDIKKRIERALTLCKQ